MQIEILIDGEKKIFTAEIVPMLAKRKYLEVMAEAEKREQAENYKPSAQDQLDEEAAFAGILANVVFGKQFTVQQLYEGVGDVYMYSKIREAVFGKQISEEGTTKNNQGK